MMFYLCGSMEYMFWSGFCSSKNGLAMAQHNSSSFPYSPTRQRSYILHGSTTTCFFVCFKGFMVVEAWAGCMSSLTQLECTRATPLIA
jgi:hypothetical protein